MERAIGVFDSGVGGLTVLNSIRSLLPNENIIYIGDNYHCPYGDKTPAQLFEYASDIVEYFIRRKVANTLIIATAATIKSNKYPETIKQIDSKIETFSLATPKLVPLVESGKYKNGIDQVLHEYLDDYKGKVQSIILGCTHYPILKEQIKNVLPNIEYVSSSEAISKNVKDILSSQKLLNFNKNNYIRIYTTGDVDEFIYSSSGFFDYTNLKVEHLIID